MARLRQSAPSQDEETARLLSQEEAALPQPPSRLSGGGSAAGPPSEASSRGTNDDGGRPPSRRASLVAHLVSSGYEARHVWSDGFLLELSRSHAQRQPRSVFFAALLYPMSLIRC